MRERLIRGRNISSPHQVVLTIQIRYRRLIGRCAASSLIPDADHVLMALLMIFTLLVLHKSDNISHSVLLHFSVLTMVNITEKIKEYEFRDPGKVQC